MLPQLAQTHTKTASNEKPALRRKGRCGPTLVASAGVCGFDNVVLLWECAVTAAGGRRAWRHDVTAHKARPPDADAARATQAKCVAGRDLTAMISRGQGAPAGPPGRPGAGPRRFHGAFSRCPRHRAMLPRRLPFVRTETPRRRGRTPDPGMRRQDPRTRLRRECRRGRASGRCGASRAARTDRAKLPVHRPGALLDSRRKPTTTPGSRPA